MMATTTPATADVPPHSRLYVNCSRSTTKEMLERAFSAHGVFLLHQGAVTRRMTSCTLYERLSNAVHSEPRAQRVS